ncbi:MAG TPA: hypothetical protein PK052_12235 [Anaerohalosphaeraceae bacterium]|nr:hypothetical protein [Phycisphaerae bacterium]HOL32736.1 hypothetical protein [Anaerohalosphaeraceae bacterium]HOM76698.1 hypothetical protein [Anaerohalosphaeraceae bacterium]HPC65312.1 hypothetical protein [Anaerohalosphaeraceae bacterium]HPO70060.1 hypothetical protein [Anaerohalosphaeraceae bacterium]
MLVFLIVKPKQKRQNNNVKFKLYTGKDLVMSAKASNNYQQQIIQNYYKNRDTILLTRLQEIVTDLYLAETGVVRKKLWKRVEATLDKMEIPQSVKAHIIQQKDVQILAKNLEEWLRTGKDKKNL